MKVKTILGTVLALSLGVSASAMAAVCDVEVDRRGSLYVVTLDGQPFKNKHYLTYDDATKLRDVLVSTGACTAAQPARCIVQENGGTYAVYRKGRDFNSRAKYQSYEAAYAHAQKLVDAKLCLVQ